MDSWCLGHWRGNCSVCSLYHVKAVFCFFLPLGLKFIKHVENKHRPIQYSLGYSPNYILCLCLFFCMSVFFLPNISNSHIPALEHINPLRLDPNRCHSNMRPWHNVWYFIVTARTYWGKKGNWKLSHQG